MRRAYTFLFYLLLPFVLVRLLLKTFKNKKYISHWYERLGIIRRPVKPGGIWIHAVSLGESVAVLPLIKWLLNEFPALPILMTHQTVAGADFIEKNLGTRVNTLYAPYDLPDVLNRFFLKVKPRLLLLVETELWPNYFYKANKEKIPIILINGRLSLRAMHRYQRFMPALTKNMLKMLYRLGVQTDNDATHFLSLGASATHLTVTGNIKFDTEISEGLSLKSGQLIEKLGGDARARWIAASTHEGEEEILLKAHALLRKKLPEALLILVPRHAERFETVAGLCKEQGFEIVSYTQFLPTSKNTGVFLGDTMGELMTFYGAAQVAFVGGSLVEKGGQNPIEPAMLGLPILTGPHTFNFSLLSNQLKEQGAEIEIANENDLAEKLGLLLLDASKRQYMGRAGKEFVEQNKGALKKYMEMLTPLIKKIIHERA